MQEYCWLGLSIPLGEEKSSGLNFTVGKVDVKKQDTFELDCNFKIKHLMFTVCSRTIQSTCIYGCRSYFFSARAFCEYWQFWQCHKTCSVQHSRHKVFMIKIFFRRKRNEKNKYAGKVVLSVSLWASRCSPSICDTNSAGFLYSRLVWHFDENLKKEKAAPIWCPYLRFAFNVLLIICTVMIQLAELWKRMCLNWEKSFQFCFLRHFSCVGQLSLLISLETRLLKAGQWTHDDSHSN